MRSETLERFAGNITLCVAERMFNRFLNSCAHTDRTQRAILQRIMELNAPSDFGRSFSLSPKITPNQFRQSVPLQTYDTLLPYIERMKAGHAQALLGPSQQLQMFALTSGTTAEPKHIPVTSLSLKEYKRGWTIFGVKAYLDCPDALFRPILQIATRAVEAHTASGIPCGSTSGLASRTQKWIVRRRYAIPACVTDIPDRLSRAYAILRLSMGQDVAFVVTASPATQAFIAGVGDKFAESLIDDIRNGGMSVTFDVPEDVRCDLSKKLRPNPAAADRLAAIYQDRGRLLPRDYWNLEFLVHWTDGTMGLQDDELHPWFGDVPRRELGLISSEGRITIPLHAEQRGGVLDVQGTFFEFIPLEHADEEQPCTLLAHEVEVGRCYLPVLTTVGGLVRYRTEDVLRVIDRQGEAPVLRFLNRRSQIASIATETVMENDVVESMRACVDGGAALSRRFLVTVGHDGYHLVIESAAGGDQLDAIARRFDREMMRQSSSYEAARRSGALLPIECNWVERGAVEAFDRKLEQQNPRGPEQYKRKHLITNRLDSENVLRLLEVTIHRSPAQAI